MTRDQAKEILALFRHSGRDREDAFFAEALEAAKNDPLLQEWLAEQEEFDSHISRSVASIAVPGDLEGRLTSIQARHHPWWNRALRPMEFAAAAIMALLIGLGGFWMHNRKDNRSASVRDYVIQQTWSGNRHVDLETANLAEIRRFIAANQVPGDFKLPSELASMRPRGCRLLHVRGQVVPFICFVEGSKHLHLAVMNTNLCSEMLQVEGPDFALWKHWTAATWTQGSSAFVLTGLRPLDFVKKFRRERQWDFGG